MRRVAAAVALLALAVPVSAGVVVWSACALPQPPRCCCPAESDGCGCGCGAGGAPGRAPEPLAPLPQAPGQAFEALPAADDLSTRHDQQPLVATLHPEMILPPIGDLLVTICTFRC